MTKRSIRMLAGALAALALAGSFPSAAQDAGGHHHGPEMHSPYAGEQARQIPTLSAEDIRQLENGEGWGLAKAAELNGVPGPAHLLEMQAQGALSLSAEQLEAIRRLHREMKERAVPLGNQLIEQERELNRRFADRNLAADELERLLAQIAGTTAALRYVHLSTHLKTLPLLSPHQIHTYNRLRGYVAKAPGAAAGAPRGLSRE